MSIDYGKIALKWQKKWEGKNVYQPEIDPKRKGFYIQVAYPYPSGAMHIGHARTYTISDIVARYHRMRGMNSLMPMGWHVSGTPVIATVELLKEGDKKTIEKMTKNFRIPEKDLKELESPVGFVDYFVGKAKTGYKAGFTKLGLGIDWRRELTTMDARYNKFIEWQYRKLYGKGYVGKGKYPIRYCPKDRNAVGDHDLTEGEGLGIQEMTLLKFKYKDMFIIAGTLRPETVFGQVNLWVNPNAEYVVAKIGNEKWVVSAECAEKLKHQKKDVEVTGGEIKGRDLLGEYAEAPGINREIIILPSKFCDLGVGSGIVTSVPSDAPADRVALRDLQNNEAECKKFGLDFDEVKKIEVIPIIKTGKWGENAAVKVCEEMGIKSQADTEKLEEAKKLVYKEGFHRGTMNGNCGKYAGMEVAKAKDLIKKEMLDAGKADIFYEMEGTAKCRCGTKVIVSVLEDQWFVKYGDKKWKEEAKATLKKMDIVPEAYRAQYENVFDWLEDKPCTRAKGLGTKFPWDETKIIEPLGDSTIYMAYFTISHLIKGINPEKLDDSVFDFVFLGKGTADSVAAKTKIKKNLLEEMKDNFDYWYPLAFNSSAIELIPNHMSFSIFQHCAIFPKEKRQKGTLNLGMLVIEGQKMASSKGNVVLIDDLADKIGADMVRFFLMSFNEPWQEVDWKPKEVETGLRTINSFITELFAKAKTAKNAKELDEKSLEFLKGAEKWIVNRFNRRMNEAGKALDKIELRKALQQISFALIQDLKWYEKRSLRAGKEEKNSVYLYIIRNWARAMAPFTPHLAEELWELSGGKGFVVEQSYPGEKKIDSESEGAETLVKEVAEDIENIKGFAKLEKPKKVVLYLAPSWKWKAIPVIAGACREKPDVGKAVQAAMKMEEVRKQGKNSVNFVNSVVKRLALYREAAKINEKTALEGAKEFLEKEAGCPIEIEDAERPKYDPANKARNALPLKPAIYLE